MKSRNLLYCVLSLVPATLLLLSPNSNSVSKNFILPKIVTSNVGTLAGNFQVTPTGQAHYSIPITVVPGTAKMQPALAITYDSSSSNTHNGLLGMGFTLEGISGITRCQNNLSQNGIIRPIKYSYDDKFCLNGEQLVVIKGVYGQDGAEYRTYDDTFARIISHGTQGDGPAYFTVETKGGQIAQYGATPDSQIKAQGTATVSVWSLNRLKDVSGNYLDVHYAKDENVGSYYPIQMDYTGNEKTKMPTYNSVQFGYETRPDVTVTYQSGSKITLGVRLKTIQILQNKSLVYSYNFSYEKSPNSFRSRLTSIQKCTGDGICLPATTFGWQTNEEGWMPAPKGYFGIDGAAPAGTAYLNMNGDGVAGVIENYYWEGSQTVPPQHYSHAWENNGSGWQPKNSFLLPFEIGYQGSATSGYQEHGTDTGTRFVDLRGLGYDDVIQRGDYGNGLIKINVRMNNYGKGWVEDTKYDGYKPPVFFSSGGYDAGSRLISLTGSGRPDLVQHLMYPNSNFSIAYRNTGSGWEQLPKAYNPPSFISYYGFGYQLKNLTDAGTRFVDLRGIGLDDDMQCALIASGYTQCYTVLNTGNGWEEKTDPDYKSPVEIANIGRDEGVRFVHLTSSGLPDMIQASLLQISPVDERKSAWINTGKGWVRNDNYNIPKQGILESYITAFSINPPDYIVTDYGVRFADLRGTGMDDVVDHFILRDYAYINDGTKWVKDDNYKVPVSTVLFGDDGGFRFVDLTGSGLPDIVKMYGLVRGAWLNKAQKYPDYLTSITDGLGAKTTIDYEPLSGKAINVYTKENTAAYPNMDWQGPMYVVYQTISDAKISDPAAIARAKANAYDTKNALNHVTTYHYIGAKLNHLGWGFLGFHQITIKDETTGITKTTTYGQDPDLHNVGKELATETHRKTGELIHATNSTWNYKKTHGDGSHDVTSYFTYLNSAQENGYDLSGKLLSTKTVATAYDDYANPLQIIETIKDPNRIESYTTTTTNLYVNVVDAAHWFLGELMRSVVTATAPNVSAETHVSAFTYDSNGLLASETIEPDDVTLQLTKVYSRDGFGNIVKTILTNADKSINRVTSSEYDALGRFIINSTNALGQKIYQETDSKFGTPVSVTDLNGLETISQYDSFGRLVSQINPDKTTTQEQYYWTSNPPTDAMGAVYAEKIDVTGHPSVIKYYDQLNRVVAKSTQGFDGRNVWQTTQYDELDRITRSSQPYYESDPKYYTLNSYDDFGRVKQTTKPDGGVITYIYDGLTTKTINPLNQTLTKTENVRGRIIQSTDNNGKSVSNKYDAYGRLVVMTDSKSNTTTMTYDKRGCKLSETDPDKGKYTYEYDVLGELIKQNDATGNITTFKYDDLGRMISRTDGKGASTWSYGNDSKLHNVGMLIREDGLANLTKDANGGYNISPVDINTQLIARKNGLVSYTKTITYDRFSRPQLTDMRFDGEDFTMQTSYDDQGRVAAVIYNDKIIAQNAYNSLGYLSAIKDGPSHKVYWQVNAMDANGNITSETHSNGLITTKVYDPATGFLKEIHTKLGMSNKLQEVIVGKLGLKQIVNTKEAKLKDANGEVQSLYYSYDKIGNLMSRDDKINNIHETFTYDDLNRITNWTATGSMSRAKSYQYDELGNMTYQSGLGKYIYDRNNAGPHAVTQITDDSGKVIGNFQYDKDGNQILSTLNNKTRNLSYTSYGKPLTIKTDEAETDFYYNANREQFERVDQITKDGKLLITKTFNFNGYEREYFNGAIRDKIYLGPYNEIIIENSQINALELLKDNLGSLTDITDQLGNVVRSYHYEPFGKQELVGQYKDVIPPLTHHGFTGHQSVEAFNLIHMDGRIYDPIIARFLSADPYIQDPTNTQSLNRYSYCINNPLAYTDPTGFDFWSKLIHEAERVLHDIGHACECTITNRYFQQAVKVGLSFLPPGINFLAETTYSAFNALIAGQGVQNAMMAAFVAGVDTGFGDLMAAEGWGGTDSFAKWSEGVVANGLEAGSVRVIQGGSFQDGFISAAVMQAATAPISKIGNFETPSRLVRAAATGIVGGTIAAITGGNFGEAAKMSSFSYLYSSSLSMTMGKGKGVTKATEVMNDGKAHFFARDIKWGPLAFLPIPIYPFIHSALYIPLGNGNYRLFGAAPETGSITGDMMIDDDVIHGYDLSDYVVLNIPGTEGGLDASRVITIVTSQFNEWSHASNTYAAGYNLFTHNCHDFNDDTMRRYLEGN